jgi:hypothetical protein
MTRGPWAKVGDRTDFSFLADLHQERELVTTKSWASHKESFLKNFTLEIAGCMVMVTLDVGEAGAVRYVMSAA